MKVKEISKDNFNEEVLNSKGVVLVDFYANWCGPCKMLERTISELEGTLENVEFYGPQNAEASGISDAEKEAFVTALNN